MYADYENSDLVLLLSQSDQGAFSELYQRYWKKLFAIAYNRLNETETAEDVVHDVFAAVWSQREKLLIGNLENYLATATKYMVFAKIKARIRERELLNTEAPLATVASAEASVHYKRILELVNQEVENLPEKCRLIFRCSRNEGMSVKQIAERFQLSPKTVENQLAKALRRLKPLGRTFFHCFLAAIAVFFLR